MSEEYIKKTLDTQTDTEKKELATTDIKEKEIGGPKGADPTRYGDWERNGRCIDF